MPSFGDPNPYEFMDWQKQWYKAQNAWTTNATMNIDSITYSASGPAEVTMKVAPEQLQNLMSPPEPIDDSPLAWLRRQVDEICEYAYAA